MSDSQRGEWARELRRHDVLPIVDESLRDVNLDGVELPPSYAKYDSRAVLGRLCLQGVLGRPACGVGQGSSRPGWMPLIQSRMTLDLGISCLRAAGGLPSC